MDIYKDIYIYIYINIYIIYIYIYIYIYLLIYFIGLGFKSHSGQLSIATSKNLSFSAEYHRNIYIYI